MSGLKKSAHHVLLVHGGPGAPGSIFHLAKQLENFCQVSVVHQHHRQIGLLINDLKSQIDALEKGPCILIGHSAGAWLSGVFTSRFPQLVLKLILIGAGPLENQYLEELDHTRKNRMTVEDKLRFEKCLEALRSSDFEKIRPALDTLQELVFITDNKFPDPGLVSHSSVDWEAFLDLSSAWGRWRSKGDLLKTFQKITCPVISFHGEYDPHPANGVSEPLRNLLHFEQYILPDCGHTPWIESRAKEAFLNQLKNLVV